MGRRRTGGILLAAASLAVAGTTVAYSQSPSAGGPRRIAPDAFPEYRQPDSSAAPPFAVVPPTAGFPAGACTRALPRVVWLRCLRETAELTSRRVTETVGDVMAAIEHKEGAAAQKKFWLRALDEAQHKWIGLRDHECQQVAPSEPGLKGGPYEARMLCMLRENERRRADLMHRYALESR
jgi:uncharacterized protein YecT (DUF1311 family)